jgi:flagellin FlaB
MKGGRFRKDEKGAIGIEILIVFIAIVLVAAVSAAVLIQTVGFLQQKAMATGRQTTQEVASGLKVVKVLGNVSSPRTANAEIDKLAIFVEVNTGGQDVDLSTTRVILSNGEKSITLYYNASASGKFTDATDGLDNVFDSSDTAWNNLTGTEFGIIAIQDEDGSLSAAYPVLNQGDKVILTVDADSAFGDGLKPRTKVSGEVRPELGAPGIIEFTTPAAYTTAVVELQ